MTDIGARQPSEILADVMQAMKWIIQSAPLDAVDGTIVVPFASLTGWRDDLHVVLEHLRREEAR